MIHCDPRNLASFECVVLSRLAGKRVEGLMCSAFFSTGLATPVAMETWPVEHRAFVYDSFVKSGESVTVTQRLFPVFQLVISFLLGVRFLQIHVS
jgi:hypothetical protein